MVGIVTGKGTGLERSSAFVLGSQGQLGSATLGRDGEGVYVNAANGNIIVTRQDEFLIGLGPDISVNRTYNSLGATDGDNNDGWRASAYRKVTGLSGTYGNAGTTVTRTDWDGSATVYTWISDYNGTGNGAYVAKDGPGAYDTLTRASGIWTWTDGSSQRIEHYDEAHGGRVMDAADTDGNLVNYTYDSATGLIASITNSNGGAEETVAFTYNGTKLTDLVTTKTGDVTLSRVHYEYENYASGTRLVSVKVDLSPDDSTISDGQTYVTTYSYYNTTTTYLASISQSDGSLVQFDYVDPPTGDYRVKEFTQTVAAGVTRRTQLEYASGRTTIIDPALQKTEMYYDGDGNLTGISYPAENAISPRRVVQFDYNGNGDLLSVTDGPGNAVNYTYDTHGNLTHQQDSAGNVVERDYGSKNELLLERRYAVADPDGSGSQLPSAPQVTHYIYSTLENHLRFVVTAEGRVTEHVYDGGANGPGLVTSTITYTANAYTGSTFAVGDLESWVSAISDKSTTERTDNAYDHRGNIQRVTSWSKVLASGAFDTTSASQKTETLYVYDQAGNLLQRTVTNPQAAGTLTEAFVYDGLNRMTLASDFYSNVTRTTFLDNRSQTVVTHANGLSEISTYNRAGERIAFSSSNAGGNLVDLSGWPGNPASPPAGNATVPGWINYSTYVGETVWASTTGPDGIAVTAIRSGQTDADQPGGGNYTNNVTIDETKAYEFTYYFKLSDLNKHSVYFGLSVAGATAYVEDASTGADAGNPYFFSSTAAGQSATFVADKWYKVVGYVLPEGAAAPASPLGGVYDAATGEKVANATATFRWNAERPNDQVYSRFFNYYGEANQQYSTYFYRPEIRQVAIPVTTGGNLVNLSGWPGDAASLPAGNATVPGWVNNSAYVDETIWASTLGPDGTPVAAIRSGQTDADQPGGGNYTNYVTIDETKAYEFTYYFKLSDLNTHSIYFGLSLAGATAYVENAVTGADAAYPYFFSSTAAGQSATFDADKWYKVVGYVLPEGAATLASPLGGVYDAATGEKVANAAATFRWNADRPNDQICSRFFNYYGEANQQYSTYFYQPEIRQVTPAASLGPDIQTSLYHYDNLGRLRMTVDPTGRRRYMMYDSVSRKIADIDADGSVIEYRYDGNDNLTSTTRYANRLNSTQLASLVDAYGNPTGAAFSTLRPAEDASNDRWTFNLYDNAQRLVQTIDGTGATTVYQYDGTSRLVSTKSCANLVSSTSLATLKARAANPYLVWNSNGLTWPTNNLTATATTLDGNSAFKFSVTTSGSGGNVVTSAGGVAAAGDVLTFTISVMGVGSLTSASFGLWGGTAAGWGADGDSTATIESGQGTLTQLYGGRWDLNGLSTSTATRITITRRFAQAASFAAYAYVGVAPVTAGDSIIVTVPIYSLTSRSAVYLPNDDASNDRVSRNFYDADGRLTGTLDAEGYLTRTVYDKAGRTIETIAYSDATDTQYRASGTFAQLLGSVTVDNSKDIHNWFVYDARGLLRASIDGEGDLTRNYYNALGDLSQIVTGEKLDPLALLAAPPTLASLGNPAGNLQTVTYSRNAFGDVTREVRSLAGSASNTIDYGYDSMRRLVSTVTQPGEADTRTMTQRYDLRGNIVGTLNGVGNGTLPASPTQAQIDAAYANFGTTFVYDKTDRLISSTDPNGNRTLYYYNADGQLAYQLDAIGQAIEYRYNSFGERGDVIAHGIKVSSGTLATMKGGTATAAIDAIVQGLTDARFDRTSHLDFNVNGTLKQSTSSLAYVTAFTYNAFGEVTSRTDPFGISPATTLVTNSGYDRRGLLATQTVDPGAAPGHKTIITTYGYDAFGRPLTLTDAENGTTTSGYDRAGRLVSKTDALNKVTNFKYDARGNLVWTRDAENHVTRFVYDQGGRLIWSVDAAGGVTQTSYDDDGRVLVTTAYATRISLTGLNDQVTEADVSGRVAADSQKDRVSRNAYDKDGRLRFVVDGVSALTEYVYDDAGNVIRTIQYGGALDPTTNYTIAYIDGKIATQGLAALPQTRISRTVYDAIGRVAYSIAADNTVVQYRYENGGVTRQRAFKTTYAPTDNPSQTTMNTWVTSHSTADDHVTRALYDSEGRLAYSIDAGNFVTRYFYDKLNHVIKQVRYAGTYAVIDTTTYSDMDTLVGATIPATAAVTQFNYDSAGRLTEIIDPMNISTFMTLDKLGRIKTSTVANGTTDASTTTYSYDAVGRVLTTTRQVDTNAANDLTTYNTYDGVGNLVKVVDAAGGITYNYYDAVGRVETQLDAERYGTDYTYTAFGEVESVTRHALRCNNYASVSLTVRPTFTADPLDATTGFEYDRRGLVTKVTDAGGYYEIYDLDEFGNRKKVTNKAGYDTLYTYDKLNRMLTETLPVDVIRGSDGATLATSVRNDYTYNAFGQLWIRTEAANRPTAEQRKTTYTYDKLDRVTLVEHDAVTVYDDVFGTTANVIPHESFTYDARGNLVLSTDAAGRQTFTYYDLADRKTDEVAGLEVQAGPVTKGVMSHWDYYATGNVKLAKVYSDLVTMPADVTSAKPVPGTACRQTSYSYDKVGRLLASTVANLRFGVFDGTNYVTTSSGETSIQRTYDKNGNVVTEMDGVGNVTWSWYDKLGRKVAQIDRENYLTTWQLDANGNALSETRYASKITGSFDTATTYYSELLALVTPDTSLDRTTSFTYDRNGHRKSERRWNVNASSVSAAGALTTTTQTAIIGYTYNALGLVASRTEANGNLSEFNYDALGRIETQFDPTITDFEGTSLRRATETYYDALGNVVRTEVNKAGGLAASDRVTTFNYGAGGRLASTTDAEGFTRQYGYDAAGRLKMEKWTRLKSDGITTVTEATSYRYDLGGRLITQANGTLNGSSWTFGDATRLRYNAFGEVTGKGVTGGPADAAVYQETFDYDDGGRLWRTNTGDGTVKIMFYDKAGNATLTLSSVGADLSATTYAAAMASLTSAGGTTTANAVTSIAVFDKRGQQIETREPGRQLAYDGSAYTTADLRSGRAYNAFGEVASETDARGYVAGGNQAAYRTEFAYNTMGRLIQKTSPEVAWTSESGIVGYAQPVEHYYYDISGRLVGVDDANGNRTTRALLAGTGMSKGEDPLVTAEFHADGGVARSFYDVFGDLRIARNELYVSGSTTDYDEVYSYDRMSRVTSVQHRGNLLTDSYAYDGLGQRIKHYNSYLGSSVADLTDYDRQGRVVTQVDMGGDTTTYSYSWSGTLATSGLGTFGGWIKTTTNPAGKSMTEGLDYFGRTVDRVDYGGHNYDFTFDKAGRMTARSNNAGESMSFGWFNTGLARSVSFGTGNSSSYAYDRVGNRTSEWTQVGSAVVQNATATYDALNRMIGWAEAGSTSTPAATLSVEYDLNGNIRRNRATYSKLNNEGDVLGGTYTQDYWYLYDSMNRFTLTRGILSGSTIGRGTDGTGVSITYDKAGQRQTVTKTVTHDYDVGDGIVMHKNLNTVDDYNYSAAGFLKEVWVAEDTYDPEVGGGVQAGVAKKRGNYTLDAMGRVTLYEEYDTAATPDVVYSRSTAYNNRSQITTETLTRKVSNETGGVDTFVDVTTNRYRATETFAGSGVWLGVDSDVTGAYMGGSVTFSKTYSTKNNADDDSAAPDTSITQRLTWWDSAKQLETLYDKNTDDSGNSPWDTDYVYNGSGILTSASIDDDRDRTVNFITDANGMILQRREVSATPTGDPRDIHYTFAGMKLGDISNNSTDNVDFSTTLMQHRLQPQFTSSFREDGLPVQYTDFDQSYDAVNGNSVDGTGSRITVGEGDTLQSIAAQVFGDASLWYLIAEANGLTNASQLVAGQSLIIPNKVANVHNSSETFRVYDPNEAMGNLSPTSPKPNKRGGCGMMGQVLMIAIAVALTIVTSGAAVAALSPTIAGIGSGISALAAGQVGLATAVAAGAVGGAVGSSASQAFGVATGIQSSFSWKGVAMGAISGAVSGGISASGVFGSSGIFGNVGSFAKGGLTGLTSSVVTQGIGVATHLQDQFSWAGVAGAAAGGAVGGLAGDVFGAGPMTDRSLGNILANLGASGAGAVANAGVRSLLNGTSFGDNLLAALPDVIGQTIGNLIGNSVVQSARPHTILPAGRVAIDILDAVRTEAGESSTARLTRNERQAREAFVEGIDQANELDPTDPSRDELIERTVNRYLDGLDTSPARHQAIEDYRRQIGIQQIPLPAPVPEAGLSDVSSDLPLTPATIGNNNSVDGEPNSIDYWASRSVDNAGIWIGNNKENIEAGIQQFFDDHPGARIAATVAETGLAVAAPARYLASWIYEGVKGWISDWISDGYQDAGWDEERAAQGGDGITFVGSLVLGGLISRMGGARTERNSAGRAEHEAGVPVDRTSSAPAATEPARLVGADPFDARGRLPRNGDRMVVNQGRAPTCGPTSVCMVLDTLGHSVDLNDIISRAGVRANGISMTRVESLLREQGVNARFHIRMSVDDLAAATRRGDPAIAAVQLPNGPHAVVVDGVTTRQGVRVVAIRDPHGVQYFERVETFRARFLGQGVTTR